MSNSITMRRVRGADYVDEPPAKRKRGRPSDYEPWMLQQAARMAHAGMTDAEIASELSISVATLYNWMSDRPDFLEAIRSAKHAPDERVKRSLFDQALAGNTTAQIFWLKNRRPHEFRDRQEHELVVPVDTTSTDEESTDVRHLALAALALITEAGNTQVIDQSPVPYDAHEESEDDGYEEDDGVDPGAGAEAFEI